MANTDHRLQSIFSILRLQETAINSNSILKQDKIIEKNIEIKWPVNSDQSVNMYLHKLSLKLSFNNGSFQLTRRVRKSIITFAKKSNIPKYHGEHLLYQLPLYMWEQEVSNVPEADSLEI